MNLIQRPRRLRRTPALRRMVRETLLSVDDLIAPMFVIEGQGVRSPIESMPGQFRFSIDQLLIEAHELYDLGVSAIALFPAIDATKKDPKATEALNREGLYMRAISALKEALPELLLMSDVALDPYSSDGHDGLVDAQTGVILNDETLEILAQMAVLQCEFGADIVGPSDMMDGRIRAIREGLDAAGFSDRAIMSYTAKYASAYYGPFRDALDSAPKSGDKKTYQMDYSNSQEALKEARLDLEEGADILMVKPGLAYLDIIRDLSINFDVPISAYQVSGEYAMIKAAGDRGWIDAEAVMIESLVAFKRAGASVILTYFAKEMAQVINNS
jgi:porphobilinogen synthase